MQFTKDTSKVLTVIYKMYLERRKNGQSKSSAKNFDLEFYKGISCLSSWSEDDITDSLSELRKANFIKEYISGDFVLQDALIIHMENRFKNGLSEVSKYLADLIADIFTGLACGASYISFFVISRLHSIPSASSLRFVIPSIGFPFSKKIFLFKSIYRDLNSCLIGNPLTLLSVLLIGPVL